MFEYTATNREQLSIEPHPSGAPSIWMSVNAYTAEVPLDHVEEVVAGIRDAARQAAAAPRPAPPEPEPDTFVVIAAPAAGSAS
jgi:hypothetical protein